MAVDFDKLEREVAKEMALSGEFPRCTKEDFARIVRKAVDRYRSAEGRQGEWR